MEKVVAIADVMTELSHAVRSGNDPHASVFRVYFIQRYPHRDVGARSDRPVLPILMPGNFETSAGRFTEHFKNVILAFVDEALWAGDRKAEGHIKGLITEPTVLIEPKFVNPYPVKNHVNFIFASNSNWIVPTGLEERRFLALHVLSDRQRDYQYFSDIKKQMKTGGVADLAHFLTDRKVTCNLREAPRTEEFLAQAIESMEPEQQFWFQTLKDGELWTMGLSEKHNPLLKIFTSG